MNNLYRQTFDQIGMSEETVQALRAELASRSSRSETEELNMKQKTNHTRPILRRTGTLLVAALLICALSISALAYGGVQVYRLLTGGSVEMGQDEDGGYYAAGSVDTDNIVHPVEYRDDGRLYLTINGENKDITDAVSYTIPYIYEFVAEDGLRHSIIIGGDLDAIGWSEFIWDEDGIAVFGHSYFATPNGSDDAPWLEAGQEKLNLPW